ncbi:MAG: hypothetical protein CMB97_00340 [Flavobacteriaceae bacterium]|nr:hypothetical protein [Flavobacteriaceae bacterium]
MSAVQVKQLFPTYHSSDRTEFRLDNNEVYLSSFRLANIQPKPSAGIAYQPLVGCGSLFKSVTLYSGATPIEEARNVHELLAFEQLRSSNQVALDLQHALNGTIWGGWKVGGYNSVKVEKIEYGSTQASAKPDDTAVITAGATLNLQSVFGFLRSDPVCPAIPNLRIVIEWRTGDPVNVFGGASAAITYDDIQAPVLFVDAVRSPALLKKVKQKNFTVPYFVNEFDRVRITAAPADDVQDDTIRLSAFRGKFVNRMLMVNVPEYTASHADNVMKKDASIAMAREKFNVRVNGRNMFALGGVDSQQKKLSLLSSTYGGINVPEGTQFWDLESRAESFLHESNVDNLRGKMSYGGWVLGDRVSEMEIVYERYGTGVAAANNLRLAFYLDVWGEVAKQLTVSGEKVVVSYA